MNQPSLLDYLTTFGTIATPILVLILTGIGWNIRNRSERTRELEEKLRDDRINIYFEILEPFIIGLMNDEIFGKDRSFKGKTKQQVVEDKLFSLEYRKAAYKLTLMGSDNVVKAFNDLMQGFYGNTDATNQQAMKLIGLMGKFLLEIRRGVGNEKTTLKHIDMLEWMITDIRQHREQLQ